MPRTTLNIDGSVLKELKNRQRKQRRPLGEIASELLAQALSKKESGKKVAFSWQSTSMGARVDLEDKEALNALLDRS